MKRFLFIFLLSFNSMALEYELSLVGKDLNQFIAWFSDTTGFTVIVDSQIDQNVSIFARKGFHAKDLHTVFKNVLHSQNLDFTVDNGVYRIFKSKANANPDDIITSFYDFKFISGTYVDALIPVLNSLFSNLSKEHYRSITNNKADDKSTVFTVESLFSGRSILLTAPQFMHDYFYNIMPKLDVSLPQVLVKVAIIESVDTDLFDLGVQWLGHIGNSSFGNNHQPSLDESLALLIDNVGFDVALAIVDKTDKVNIKSMPQLLILHGEKGGINVGQNVPFLSGSTVSSGVNSGNPYQTIERQDVGLILKVQPFITNNNIVVNIEQELSSISSDIQASDIVTDKRSLITTLNIKSGESVVLGGLVSDTKINSVSGIPLLMDIPYIGKAFTNKTNKTVTRNLSIVLEVLAL